MFAQALVAKPALLANNKMDLPIRYAEIVKKREFTGEYGE